MKTTLRFDSLEGKKDETVDGLTVIFREGDILKIAGKYYAVQAATYDLTKNESVYSLAYPRDAHPKDRA